MRFVCVGARAPRRKFGRRCVREISASKRSLQMAVISYEKTTYSFSTKLQRAQRDRVSIPFGFVFFFFFFFTWNVGDCWGWRKRRLQVDDYQFVCNCFENVYVAKLRADVFIRLVILVSVKMSGSGTDSRLEFSFDFCHSFSFNFQFLKFVYFLILF